DARIFRVLPYALDEVQEAALKGSAPEGITADEMLYLTITTKEKERILAMNRLVSLMAKGGRVHPLVRYFFADLPGTGRLEWRNTRRGKPPFRGKQLDIIALVGDAIRKGHSESEANALAAKEHKVSKRYVQKVMGDWRKRRGLGRLAKRERT